MPLRLKWQLFFCFSTSCGSTYLHALTEDEILNNYNKNSNNPLYLKSALPLTKCFQIQDLIFTTTLPSILVSLRGLSIGFSSFTLHSLPGKYYPCLWFQPPPIWWCWPDFYFQLSAHTGDTNWHMQLSTELLPGLTVSNLYSTCANCYFLLQICSLQKFSRIANNTITYSVIQAENMKVSASSSPSLP